MQAGIAFHDDIAVEAFELVICCLFTLGSLMRCPGGHQRRIETLLSASRLYDCTWGIQLT